MLCASSHQTPSEHLVALLCSSPHCGVCTAETVGGYETLFISLFFYVCALRVPLKKHLPPRAEKTSAFKLCGWQCCAPPALSNMLWLCREAGPILRSPSLTQSPAPSAGGGSSPASVPFKKSTGCRLGLLDCLLPFPHLLNFRRGAPSPQPTQGVCAVTVPHQ